MRVYKYLNSDGFSRFLNAPLLRISNNNCLNDPFEYVLTSKDVSSVFEVLRAVSEDSHIRSFYSTFKGHGIISLTETKDNLLMWSHYAEEHKGAVFGFDFNDPNDIFLHKGNNKKIIPSKVYYRKLRGYEGEINKNNIKDVLLHYLSVKSDEWSYEKEFRFIVPYDCADVIIINNKKPLYERIISDMGVLDQNIIQCEDISIIDVHRQEINDIGLLAAWTLSYEIDAMFFKVVDAAAIKECYIGCRVNTSNLFDVCNDIIIDPRLRENFLSSELGVLRNFYKSEINNERFELNFKLCEGTFLDSALS
ncbi:DUF2971 domain-containing protein [Dickeya zeae]|uniref:DUF2971 domain-containing protein n=1 Tax=Dickeya zeae TaxID=204042 RepID=UPI00143FE550|nr:DUF2971 domain-containing protein [Dickeya zeae]QIZ47696.1 DUF2971 domain-containing protein [Dickeya zeae]